MLVEIERIESTILHIRSQKVLLDEDLAELYQVDTRALTQQVRRNIERFPGDFMFQLSDEEWQSLRSHNVISKGRGASKAHIAGLGCALLGCAEPRIQCRSGVRPPLALFDRGLARLAI